MRRYLVFKYNMLSACVAAFILYQTSLHESSSQVL